MDLGVDQTDETNDSNVKQTHSGSREFRGDVEMADPNAPRRVPAPDGIPDKFWDPIEGKLRQDDLIKSYHELEKRIGSGKDDDETDEDAADEADEVSSEKDEDGNEGGDDKSDGDSGENGDEDEGDEEDDSPQALFNKAAEQAAAAYAEAGELSDEARKPLKDLGISDDQINLYLSGVKATEAALQSSAEEAAGSPENLQAAMKWAFDNWSDKKKTAFNAQTGDVETVGSAVAGLMADFRKANPGEGHFQNINSGGSRGDVYESMDDFRKDLKAADDARDMGARKKAVDKLRRSRKAGTVKGNRRQPFGG